MKAVIDTNILVDYLAGLEPAREELDRYTEPAVSVITRMELLVGARDEKEDRLLRDFLSRFETLPLDDAVAEAAVRIRRNHRIRLPDAIIWGTARTHDRLLVTRNIRDFPESDPGIRVPYIL